MPRPRITADKVREKYGIEPLVRRAVIGVIYDLSAAAITKYVQEGMPVRWVRGEMRFSMSEVDAWLSEQEDEDTRKRHERAVARAATARRGRATKKSDAA